VSGQVDEAILVEAAQEGDTDAFAALVRRHRSGVYRVALRMLDSPADAQDVTQETFTRAWRGLRSFRRDSALSTWLYRIVTRRCLDVIAARTPAAEDLGTLELRAPEAEPAESVEQGERLRAVTVAISRLPGDQRAALVLREFEGLSYQQVAVVLGITVPAVKGRIHRARLSVLEQMEAWV
jgi:RNA polymerase sigma-70 factor, ECF subfamily